LALLAMALFDVGLAVAGLATGVVHVPRGVELALFGIAAGLPLAAAWLVLARLLGEVRYDTGRWMLRRLPLLRRERVAERSAVVLLVLGLFMGLAVAGVRSGAGAGAPPRSPARAVDRLSRSVDRLSGAVGRLSQPGHLVVQSSSGHVALIAALIGAGMVLALVAVALSARAGRVGAAAVATGAGGAATLATALALTLDHVDLHPHLTVAPTVTVGQATLFSLQQHPHITVHPRVVPAPAQPRPLALLSLGGLRISIRSGGGERPPCSCGRVLPVTP
jgi:uncharacterized membrane protein YagU involved in acid resistance